MAFQNPIGWRGIRCGGEVLIFVSEDIPSKELKSLTIAAKDNENIFVKISGLATEAATAGVLYKKGVLKDFAKFTGKHLWQSLFFNKVAALRPVTLLKNVSGTGAFL